MSFQPNVPKVAAAHEGAADPVLAYLEQDASVAKVRGMDPSKADRMEDEARRKTLRLLNAIKVISPLLTAIMETPATEMSSEKAANAFRDMVSTVSLLAERVSLKIGANPDNAKDYWIRNVLERVFAEALRDQWVKNKKIDVSFVESCMDKVLLVEGLPEASNDYENLSSSSSVKVALVRAATAVMVKAQTGFDFFRNVSDDLEPILEKVRNAALSAAGTLTEANTSEKERAVLFSMLLTEAGSMYATSWWSVGKETVESLSRLSDKDMAKLLKENPKGLPLDRVNEMFDRNFARLVSLSAKLAPPKAGKIEDRVSSAKKSGTARQP